MISTLPSSLRRRIDEAKRAVEQWQDDEDDDSDKSVVSVRDFTQRLSQGEYDQPLYWECVAEDCEATGDFVAAIAAYRKMAEVGTSEFTSINAIRAHGAIAGLLSLLGQHRQALKECRNATALARGESKIFHRSGLIREAYQYLKLNRRRAAELSVRQALASFVENDIDGLNYARLKTLEAECCLRRNKLTDACDCLHEAWPHLEHFSKGATEAGLNDEGSGVNNAYAEWWKVEARRRKITGVGSETEALEQALARTKKGAEGWQRLGWDAAVMQALLILANAYEREGRLGDAESLRTEAEEIRLRWHLPTRPKHTSFLVRVRTRVRELLGEWN
jgi:tetratricopeptide (TPR) repeat protein